MVTGIPLPTVRLGLSTFAKLGMIDSKDGAIFIKNWIKYQSEDKLEARREKDRLRQQRHREKEREKLRSLPSPDEVSRDSNVIMSRDVTQENRQDKSRVEKTTTEEARLLLSGTPLGRFPIGTEMPWKRDTVRNVSYKPPILRPRPGGETGKISTTLEAISIPCAHHGAAGLVCSL